MLFYAGHENLTIQLVKEVTHSSPVAGIQLRWQIIKKIDAFNPAALGQQIALSDLHRTHKKLLLPPRQHLSSTSPTNLYKNISTVRSQLSCAIPDIFVKPCLQRSGQFFTFIPSASIGYAQASNAYQALYRMEQQRMKQSKIFLTRPIYMLREATKLEVPSGKLHPVWASLLEQQISMRKAFGCASPRINEIMFHVEHAPI